MNNLYICHQTALAVYRSPKVLKRLIPPYNKGASNDGLAMYGSTISLDIYNNSINDHRIMVSDSSPREEERFRKPWTEADLSKASRLLQLPAEQPLHILVPHHSMRRNSRNVRCHVWQRAPSARFIMLEPGIYLSTPAFVYRQMLAHGDFENRLMLASELVGNYALDPTADGGIVQRHAVCTIEDMLLELDETRPFKGARGLIAALNHVLPHARSPKEVQIGALLGLPRRLGGQGLHVIEHNRPIPLPSSGQTIARRSYLEADCYLMHEENWQSMQLSGHSDTSSEVDKAHAKRLSTTGRPRQTVRDHDVEYDSNSEHLTARMNESDKRRANALKTVGIELTTITSGQLHSWPTFLAIARQLALDTGSTLAPPTQGILDKQYSLWRRLLFGKPVNGRVVVPDDAPSAERPKNTW